MCRHGGGVFIDDDGTTVSALAERAGVTKQAMAELMTYLEANGYVRRMPGGLRDPCTASGPSAWERVHETRKRA